MENKVTHKLLNWPLALHKYVASVRETPFEWGKFDCVLFAVSCVEAMTGKPIAKPELTYTDEAGAKALAAEVSLIAELKSQLGALEVPFKMMQQGDLIIYKEDGLEKTNVCLGSTVAVAWPNKGVVLMPLSRCPQENAIVLRVN